MTQLWLRLPVWVRQTIMECSEAIGAAILGYLSTTLETHGSVTAAAIATVVIKTAAKYARSNPYINIPDYVNDHK